MNDLFDKRICVQHDILDREDIMMFKDKRNIDTVKKNQNSLVRPVGRKKLPSEQFEDDLNGKAGVNVKKRPISTSNLMRPPSRHKSPPKALELGSPAISSSHSKIKIKSFENRRPSTSKCAKLDLGNHQGLYIRDPSYLVTEDD